MTGLPGSESRPCFAVSYSRWPRCFPPQLRRGAGRFVRRLHRYYQQVRLLQITHGLWLSAFPMSPCARLARVVRRPLGSRSEDVYACQGLQTTRSRPALAVTYRLVLLSADWRASALRMGSLSSLNGWPTCSPVNASRAASRPTAHDSGAMWFATPSGRQRSGNAPPQRCGRNCHGQDRHRAGLLSPLDCHRATPGEQEIGVELVAASHLGDRRPFREALFNDPTLLVSRPGSPLAYHRREITVIPNRHHRWCPSSDSGHDHRATLQTDSPNIEISARRPA